MSTPTSEFFQRLIALGYPESVARRIASGDLVMDYASRMQRASEQGYDPRTYYHGGAPNLLSIDPTVSSSRKTEGTGTWFSDMPEVANSYLSKDSQLYPVRINTQGMDTIDAEGAGWASLPSKNLMRDGAQKYPYPDGHTLSSDVMANMAREGGRAGLVIDNVVDLGPNFRMPKQINDDWRQWLLDYEQKGGRSVSVQDPNRVRSVNAAFDPEYVGPNMLGNADPRLLAGIGTAGLLGAALFPQDAEAGPLTKLRNVFPAPQRFFDPQDKAFKPFLGQQFEPQAGGRYLQMGDGAPKDITGEYPNYGLLSVSPEGKPAFQVSDVPAEAGAKTGRKIKTNLFKRRAGWTWTQAPEGFDPDPAGDFPLISVQDGKQHYYTLSTEFPEGVELSRYEKSATEPRLRPTRQGSVELGNVVGEISVRGKKHPVYDRATVRDVIGAGMAVGTAGLVGGSLLGAGVAPKVKAEEAKPKEVDPFVQALMDYTSDANFLPSPSERLIPMSEIPAEMRANNPDTIRDITNWAGNAMGGDYWDYRAAEGLMNVADFLPYIGGGISLQQGADAYRNNRKWEGRMLTGLGLLEAVPLFGKMASESIKPVIRPTIRNWDKMGAPWEARDGLLKYLESL